MNESHKEAKPFFFAFDYELKNGIFLDGENLQCSDIVKFRVGDSTNAPRFACEPHKKSVYLKFVPESIDSYARKFARVRDAILAGETYLLNLSCKTRIETDFTFDEIFYRAETPYAIAVKDKFVCFSPETFVKITDGRISSYPMKGTIDAALPAAEVQIINNSKEFAEHTTVVDLIRNDLSAIAKKVRVPRFRFVQKVKRAGLSDILQISSEVTGEVCDIPLGDLIFAMLPAGSISGAPKARTLEIIREAEGMDRGFYTGVFGYFDGKNLNSAVAIRFIENDGSSLYYRSGGGITFNSAMHSEYDEVIQKIYLPFAAK